MIRYWKQCGALLEDDAYTCPFCGKTFDMLKSKNNDEESDLRKKITKKQLLIIGGILVAIIAIFVIVNQLFFSPASAIKKYEAVLNGEFKNLRSLAPDECWSRKIASRPISIDAYIAVEAEKLEVNYVSALHTGSQISVKIRVLDEKSVGKADLEGIRLGLEETYGIDQDRVKGAQTLYLRLNLNTKMGPKTALCVVTAVKIDSEWYLIRCTKATGAYHTMGAYRVNFIVEGTVTALDPHYV